MANAGSLLKRLLALHKYPFYLQYAFIKYIKQALWRRQGIVLGRGITWWGSPILSRAERSTLSIGAGCVVCSRSDMTALGVNHPVVLRTLRENSILEIGEGVRMSGTTICAMERVRVGDGCVIGANVTIVDTDFHALDQEMRVGNADGEHALHDSVEIGDKVFIGGGAIILKGVKIGRGAVIGAGSVVTRDVPENGIAAGNPARLIGSREGSGEA